MVDFVGKSLVSIGNHPTTVPRDIFRVGPQHAGGAPGNHQCLKSRADLQRWASTFDVEQYNLLSNNCQTFVIELVAYAIDQDVREAKRIIERTLRMPLS